MVVLIVIDGLGSVALHEAAARGDTPGLSSAALQSSLTSVFPATTAAATTSLQYGLAPGTHGMAGYTLYLPEIDDVFNMITWRRVGTRSENSDDPQPEAFLSHRHLFSRFDQCGIDTVIVSNAAFSNSPLTRAQASGVRYRGYRTLAEFSYRLIREIERPGRRFVFGYWDGYDALGHTWGTDAEIARLEVRLIDKALREGLLATLESEGKDVALIVTADHGHIPTPRDERFNLKQVPGLLQSLRHRPTGEPRQLGLAFTDGQASWPNKVAACLGNEILALDMHEAIAAGLYGPAPLHPQLASRTGDVLLLARNSSAVNFPGGGSGSLGGHGSLTPHEMQVPLLVWRFSPA